MSATTGRLAHALFAAGLLVPPDAGAQSRAAQLIAEARAQIAGRHLDSADVLLRSALDSATQPTVEERQSALVWRAILEFARGNDSLTRTAFRQALALDTSLSVGGLDRVAPGLAAIFEQEKEAAFRRTLVYLSGDVDELPRRLAGPAVAYPGALLRHRVAGRARVSLIVDTLGNAERASIKIVDVPDSGLIDPVKQMVLASRYSPGRKRGTPVRVMILMAIDVRPPQQNATELVTTARAELASRRPDSALSLLELALDTALAHPSEGERVYALLVRGMAWSASGRDSLARADFRTALAAYQSLLRGGVALAPFLRRLADSVRQGRRGAAIGRMAAPTALSQVDEQPALLSHAPIRYPPEMQALGAGGTVIVEATLDTTGRVEPQSVKIVESPNPGFDEVVRGAVRRSVYRPAKTRGRPVRVTIRQAVTFATY